MKKKRKAAQVLRHPDGGGQQIVLPGFEKLSDNDYIKNFSPAQGTIAAFLRRGRAAALTTRQLVRLTGMKPREITRLVCLERRRGTPILSSPAAGFWLAESGGELKRCTAALHRRAGQVHETARALESILK